ncbi:prepilin-type N-terminal cleavage/methylation domain-containing protein [Candidatus Wolfebacteria bacterium]|nr:prepilin-type N-terminal cleavage/methylation domain-containing protein [Candidatus Wolfebacteria bacterium]
MKGFTVIELIITIAISSVLMSLMLVSNYSIREQYSLFQDQYRLYSLFNEVKNFSLAAYARDPNTVCGYGISFQAPRDIIIYRDFKDNQADLCSFFPHNFQYSELSSMKNDEILDEKNSQIIDKTKQSYSFKLSETANFDFGGSVSRIDVLFVAPNPSIFIVKNGNNSNMVNNIAVRIKTTRGNNSMGISINNFGQISMIQ